MDTGPHISKRVTTRLFKYLKEEYELTMEQILYQLDLSYQEKERVLRDSHKLVEVEDWIGKVHDAFPSLNLHWVFLGDGHSPRRLVVDRFTVAYIVSTSVSGIIDLIQWLFFGSIRRIQWLAVLMVLGLFSYTGYWLYTDYLKLLQPAYSTIPSFEYHQSIKVYNSATKTYDTFEGPFILLEDSPSTFTHQGKTYRYHDGIIREVASVSQ